jgi:hypothetical protein
VHNTVSLCLEIRNDVGAVVDTAAMTRIGIFKAWKRMAGKAD